MRTTAASTMTPSDSEARRPDVSIIIPVFNRPALVRSAIESALASAPASRSEVIAVDDCSTDETWDVVRSYEPAVRAVRLERNAGQAGARNQGLDIASGEFVKFLDSDDLLVAGHVDVEVAAARAAEADIVVSGWSTFFENGRETHRDAPRFESIVDDVLAGRAVTASAALYRREVAARWDPSLPKLADWDYFVQSALAAQRIVTLPSEAFRIREHGGARVSSTTMVVNARSHHAILRKVEERLAREGKLTAVRRLRLAQYYYKELRVLALYDQEAFERGMAHIFELDPHFRPRDEERQRWMRAAARILGTRRAVLLYTFVKRRLRGA